MQVNYTSIKKQFFKRCSSPGMGAPQPAFRSPALGSVSSFHTLGEPKDEVLVTPGQSSNVLFIFLCSSHSILNTSSSNALAFGDGLLERRQYEDQGLGDTTPLTIICQPTQVRLTSRAMPSTPLLLTKHENLLLLRPAGFPSFRAQDHKRCTTVQREEESDGWR